MISADSKIAEIHLPFLVDKFDTASADTWVVQRFVWCPLRATHTANISCRHKQNLCYIIITTSGEKVLREMTCGSRHSQERNSK